MTAMRLTSLCAIVLSFGCVNMDASSDNFFIFPSTPGPSNNFAADLTLTLGSTQNISWSTTIDSYSIALFQQGYNPQSWDQIQTVHSVDSDGTGQQSIDWRVQTYSANLTFSPVYFLWLKPGDPQGFTCHYFNITEEGQSSSATSSSTASASSTSLTSSMTASSVSSTPTQTGSQIPVPSPMSASSNTEPLRVGLGVGLGIGIPLVLIAGVWIGLKLVKARRPPSRDTKPGVPLSQYPDTGYPPNSYTHPDQSNHDANPLYEAPGRSYEIHEASGERAPIELGSRDT